MNVLCDKLLRSLPVQRSADIESPPILKNIKQIEDILLPSREPLHELRQGSNTCQRCESYALELHVSFAVVWLCRLTLRKVRGCQTVDESQKLLVGKYDSYLLKGTQAFLQLHSLSSLASSSWPIMHNGLSLALSLGLLYAKKPLNLEVNSSLGDVLDLFVGSSGASDRSMELSKQHQKAVSALKRLYNIQSKSIDRTADESTEKVPGIASGSLNEPLDLYVLHLLQQ